VDRGGRFVQRAADAVERRRPDRRAHRRYAAPQRRHRLLPRRPDPPLHSSRSRRPGRHGRRCVRADGGDGVGNPRPRPAHRGHHQRRDRPERQHPRAALHAHAGVRDREPAGGRVPAEEPRPDRRPRECPGSQLPRSRVCRGRAGPEPVHRGPGGVSGGERSAKSKANASAAPVEARLW
jgi:hypothetical protein